MTNVPALGVRQQPQSPAHAPAHRITRPRRHIMAPWGVVACVAAFVLCELALVLA